MTDTTPTDPDAALRAFVGSDTYSAFVAALTPIVAEYGYDSAYSVHVRCIQTGVANLRAAVPALASPQADTANSTPPAPTAPTP